VVQLHTPDALFDVEPRERSGDHQSMPDIGGGARPTSVLLVDGHPVALLGLRALLAATSDLRVIAEASRADDAVVLATATRPDLILLDPRVPGARATELSPRLRFGAPTSRVVLLVGALEDPAIGVWMAGGVDGVLVKDVQECDLVDSLRRIGSGEAMIDSRAWAAARTVVTLSPREGQVLRLADGGMSTKAMASELELSRSTVRTYVESLRRKLRSTSTLQALAEARTLGLL
jgi:DNA-binding NarL/FixJ family response regulator